MTTEGHWHTAPALYITFTDDGKIVSFNETACALLGYDSIALEGTSLDTLLPVSSRIFYQTHWFPTLRLTQVANELFVLFRHRNKTDLPFLLNSKRQEINGVMVTACVGILVSNRMKYEDELLAARKAYESALSTNSALFDAREQLAKHTEQLDRNFSQLNQQHTELRQISKVVTHDLQEPLRKLLYYADVLNEYGETLSADVAKKVNRLQSVSLQLQRRIGGLQQYMWLTEDASPLNDVSLNRVIEVVKHTLDVRFGTGGFILHCDPLPDITGNERQLEVLFTHLLDNAVRFVASDKKPVVKIRAVQVQNNQFRNLKEEYRYTDHVRLEIEDNGVGIEDGLQKQVFAMFYSSNNPHGAGMGLALVSKIVEFHHGTISLISQIGKGTTVTINFPMGNPNNHETK